LKQVFPHLYSLPIDLTRPWIGTKGVCVLTLMKMCNQFSQPLCQGAEMKENRDVIMHPATTVIAHHFSLW
jgi:hypothetical protein